jgi:ADP-ribose pyrophosphatase YjhB (NUDIX family)
MTWYAHVSVATVVERDGLFLMVEEEEIDQRRIVFNQPAGHLEDNETLFTAAIRETLEETRWSINLEALVGIYHYKSPKGVTYLRYSFAAKAIEEFLGRDLDTGIIAAHWMTAANILAADFPVRSPIVQQNLRDYLSGVRYPLNLIKHLPLTTMTMDDRHEYS